MFKPCTICKGTGNDPKAPKNLRPIPACPHCQGSGEEPVYRDEEDLDDDEEAWDRLIADQANPDQAEQQIIDPFDDDIDEEEDDKDEWD